ncbi:MAG: immune inhibitor A [Candidatus Thermoplasmatota archaeon]|nr:hypothetical protein [Euryarchaeota archaeon]MBU4071658.1 immune inhibitor A [Candidatus Thermoplasmatota archaeon]MBU4144907.1 immune inhibitor A [Candidatus Thermoplasmatota archaeon]MBU4591107.1 immune inhibitor A [Candidatus Thermoplasmatota archaeon]
MNHISKAMWAVSLSLAMVLSPFVLMGNVDSAEISGVDTVASKPLPAPLISYNPWPVYNGTTVYHSFTEMETELFWIANNYPQITKLVSIGKSWQGRDIWAMKVSDNPQIEETDEPEVYFNSNHHAREWMTIEIALYTLRFLTNQYATNTTVFNLVNSRQIWVIPSANPDGRVYDGAVGGGDDPANHARQAYGWRKNMRDNDNSGTFSETQDGVDLNRNYGYLWGAAGAVSDPTYDTYGGPYPFSEPESAAIRDFARLHNFVFAISFHSYSQLVLYPWGWTFEDAPDNDALVSVANAMAGVITNNAGSAYPGYTPGKSSGLYPTSGSDDDWLYGELGVFAYCIEVYPNVNDNDAAVTGTYDLFHPREDKVIPVCQDNLPAILLMCQLADNKFQLIDHVTAVPETQDLRNLGGTSGTAFLNITDDGQSADSYTISRTNIAGWTFNLNPTSMSLAKDETRAATLGITVPAEATPGIYKIWVNATSGTHPTSKDSTLITVEVPYPDDVSPITLLPFTEMGDFPKGQYRIDSTVTNVGTVAVPAFNSQLTIEQLGVGSTVTVFQDDIETDLTNQWTIIDHDLANSVSVWQRSTTQKHAGTYSAWCGSGTAYTDDTIQSLQMTQSVSLERYNSATLQFWSYYNTEEFYDFLMVEGSPDNGQSWDYITRYNGAAASWQQRTLDLSDYLGTKEFKLRFRCTSDGGVTAVGFFLDDLIITANDPNRTTVYGPVQLPTSGGLASEVSETLSWNYNFTTAGTYLATVETLHGTDGNPANNIRDVMFYINNSRTMPEFDGIKSVTNLGMDNAMDIEWDSALQINDPITYRVYRFDHAPSGAEVDSATPVWGGTSTTYTDPGLTLGMTYYYVVRMTDDLGQSESNVVTISGTPGISVEHWGPTDIATTEQRFMRGVTDEGGMAGYYLLGTTQSATARDNGASLGNNVNLYAGIRVWKRTSGGTETEITSGTAVAIAYGTAISIWTATWTPPETVLDPTDSIVVRVYVNTGNPPTTVRATFVTEQLGATQLDANEWTASYYLRKAGVAQGGSRFFWGTTTYNSNIGGFTWSISGNPLDHNTINWTASPPEIIQYNIYRSDIQTGPWDIAHLVTSVPAGTFTFIDLNKGQADATYWWYVVRGQDGYGVEETNTNAVQEPGGGTPYDIDLTGRIAGDWAFVSFPVAVSDNIETILDDPVTDWDVAKTWYNGTWLTYRKGATTNTFSTINNQMGVWIHLTADGGSKLSLGIAGPLPPVPVQIPLYAGWNMVGYPSETNIAANLALAGTGATIISVYTPTTPFIQDYTDLASVTMTHGEAYWVFVPSGTTWDVPYP